jgi:hypothetical protein
VDKKNFLTTLSEPPIFGLPTDINGWALSTIATDKHTTPPHRGSNGFWNDE